jgi:membrane fusion protein, multidrug efflux system
LDAIGRIRRHPAVVAGALLLFVVCACERHEEKRANAPREVDVAVMTVTARDTPVTTEFVGQTQSSRQVEIRARVDGFLDKRLYTEGGMVKAGEVMFRMDPKPFQAQLNAAQGALAAQRARLQVAGDNLARVKPLTAQNALSEKDLDDAIGQEQAAAAAVETAKAQVEQARLNLGYTVISSPLTGLSSYARVQEGAYVNALNSLLTYVAQTDPIWVNFSISENEVLRIRGETERGFYRAAKDGYEVEVVLADGSVFPKRGRITFANADYNPQTGTFLMRATLPNPDAALRPGQFVRVVILGGVRPNAVLVPQPAVLQGAKGHFVWVVDAQGKARIRNVQVGPWHGDQWFIDSGLTPGETVVVDGVMRLAEGAAVRIGEGGRP